MSEDLIQVISSIESEADRIVEEGRKRSVSIIADVEKRVEEIRSEFEDNLNRESEELSQRMDEELSAEEARLDEEFHRSCNAIDSVSEEEIDDLSGRLVEKIKGFQG